MSYNLTNQAIEDSFQPLLQIDSGSALRDGTGSLVDNINVTASYAESSSYAVTASFALNAGVSDWDEITNKPSGLVSGSSQIDLGQTFGTASHAISASYAVSASYEIIKEVSSSYADTVPFDGILNKPTLVSSSAQVSDLTASLLDNATAEFSQITFTNGDGSTFEVDVTPRRVVESVKNKNGFMPKGTPVYVSGSTGNELHVYAADASDANRIPATFILDQDLNPEESGLGILSGFINGVDTSLFADGTSIYLAPGGGYTDVKPTGSAYIQKLGNVVKSDINGSGVISGAGRVNDLPNLQSGYAWVGDVNGVPQAVSTASWDAHSDLTQLNQFTASQEIYNTGINQYTASNDSKVNSLIAATGSYATTGSNTFIGNQNIIGELTSSIAKSNVIVNPQVITDNITVGADNNAFVLGPVTFDGSVTLEGDSELYIFSPPPLGQYLTTQSYQVDSASFDSKLTSLINDTGSYATTGSNSFIGNQTISGSFIASGSYTAFGGPTHTLLGRTRIEAPGNDATQLPGIIISGSTEIFGAPFILNQGDLNNRQNDWSFGTDSRLRISWPNTAINMTNGAFQFQGSQGIGLFFDAPGIKVLNTVGENHTLAFSAQPGNFGSLNITPYTGSCAGIIYNQTNSFSTPTKLLVGAKVSSSFDDTLYTDMSFYSSGSANISTLKLREQDPLPAGAVGDLATSGSALYFHDGTNWRTVNLT